jgi:hypothetical protein
MVSGGQADLLVSGEHISDGERPYMLHTMFVLATLVGVLGEYRWRSLRAAGLLHEAELNRIRLQASSRQDGCKSCRHKSNRTFSSIRLPRCAASAH